MNIVDRFLQNTAFKFLYSDNTRLSNVVFCVHVCSAMVLSLMSSELIRSFAARRISWETKVQRHIASNVRHTNALTGHTTTRHDVTPASRAISRDLGDRPLPPARQTKATKRRRRFNNKMAADRQLPVADGRCACAFRSSGGRDVKYWSPRTPAPVWQRWRTGIVCRPDRVSGGKSHGLFARLGHAPDGRTDDESPAQREDGSRGQSASRK